MSDIRSFLRTTTLISILSIVITAAMIVYIHTSNINKYFEIFVQEETNKYIQRQKELLFVSVNNVAQLAQYKISLLNNIKDPTKKANLEKVYKQEIIDQVRKLKYFDNNYVFIYELHNINGGKDFATMLVNINRPDLEGKFISDDYKDPNGKQFRRIFLSDIRKTGESYVTYAYKKPNSEKIVDKLSYFYLQKDWNWVIANGAYIDDLNQKINNILALQKQEIHKVVRNGIIFTSILSILFASLAFFLNKKIGYNIMSFQLKEKQKDRLLFQQSKMAAMGEMMEHIAHQWRQPLSMISTTASGTKLNLELGIIGNQEIFEDMDKIVNNTNYLSQTIDDFRGFFREDKEISIFDLKKTIEKNLLLLDSGLKAQNIKISKNLGNDIFVQGYENELTQALLNIFNNARDALSSINDENNRNINIEVYKDKYHAIIKIEDNAGGIQKDIINKIFDPYFTTKGQSGTGIGLHMTKRIIEENFKGMIEVQNKEGIGACFIITLECK